MKRIENKNIKKSLLRRSAWSLLLAATLAATAAPALAQEEGPKEEDYFKILNVPTPEGHLLEVGGMTMLPNGDLALSTRRGDVFVVENPTSRRPYFRRFASGLHEVLGLSYKDGALYCVQRGELTKLVDTNHDGKADVYETVYNIPLTGNYHEYSYGPKIAPDGSFFISGNVGFFSEQWWRGASRVPWRGWILNVSPEGRMTPWATGMRSPAGLGVIDGELFYSDNQGDYIGTGGIWHIKKGDFVGHPAGLNWTGLPNSPLKLTAEQYNKVVNPREDKNEKGGYIKPENVVNEKFLTKADVRKIFPELTTQAVVLPHTILGISNSEPIKIPDNAFGPFGGQILIGDQGQSKIMRVAMEKVKGEYQGAAFDFRGGFQSGVMRLVFAPDGSLFVGETNRGWGSAGEANEGLQRLVWNKNTPFEMRTIKAMPDGFEIEFTQPADRKTAEDLASYAVESFTYKLQPVYGSPPVNQQEHKVKGVKVSEDGLRARILVDNLRQDYVYNITLEGLRGRQDNSPLMHTNGFYTLNNIPDGQKLAMNEVSTRNSGASYGKMVIPTEIMKDRFNYKLKAAPPESKPQGTTKPTAAKAPAKAAVEKAPTFAAIRPLLMKNNCLACHNEKTRQVGPSYREVAKRKYSNEQIVKLIHNPKPENWPDYATEMPPMPQVPVSEALKIAAWINSLR
ncbi:MAG: c-type cytochrome [Adhaeribacter sp.]